MHNIRRAIRRFSTVLFGTCCFLFSAIFLLGRAMPEQFSVVSGYDLKLNGAVQIDTRKAMEKLSTPVSKLAPGSSYHASLQLFGVFPIKEVTVNVVDVTTVIPSGMPFGIKMYTDGVLVVGMSDVDTKNGPKNPAKEAGIKVGDVLVMIDGKPVNTTEQVAAIIEKAGGRQMCFRIRRGNITFDMYFSCVKSVNENCYKAGLWVRDSSAGIGTMTFYIPGSNVFGGLGHAICDIDTGEPLPLASGEIVPARIYSIIKGQSGEPGELRGGFELGTLGNLSINSETGIYGILNKTPISGQPVPIAMKQQVRTGAAKLLTTTLGTTPELYEIKIEQVRYNDSSPTRNMVISITDKRLLDKTGGIIQGMSGSPILQDGRLIGAITHVFVNDPTKGFAIFAENMLKTANTVQQMAPAA
ncbi:MAG: SpoIVB peptidase [Clostridiales bacterium]|nr:SpoIVB peptidase [Clostridiales bacterium]